MGRKRLKARIRAVPVRILERLSYIDTLKLALPAGMPSQLRIDLIESLVRKGDSKKRFELAPEKWTPRGLVFLTLWRFYEDSTQACVHA